MALTVPFHLQVISKQKDLDYSTFRLEQKSLGQVENARLQNVLFFGMAFRVVGVKISCLSTVVSLISDAGSSGSNN